MTAHRLAMLAAAAVTCLAAGARAAEAKPCVPVAHLTGDAEVVRELAAALIARSVTVEQHSECGVVTARVTKDDAHIVVRVTDADGRRAQRSADDVESAATIVESWLRRDLAAPLLAARLGPVRPKHGAARDPALVAGASPERRGFEVGTGADLGVGADGSVWTGVRAQGCFSVGRACVGALVRVAVDTEIRGDADELQSSRSLFDMLVTVDLPLSRGRFSFAPGAGVGQTLLRASGHEKGTLGGGEEIDEDTAGIRFRVHARASYALSANWALRADAAVGVVGFAAGKFGELEQVGDETDDDTMAGMPALHTWLGLSIGYGGL